jgi:hypothetical protein
MAFSNRGFKLQAGLVLNENEFLESNNGIYFAVLQGDHNFVIYKGRDFSSSNAIWNSGTYNVGNGPARLVAQSDNNLVIYDQYDAPIWNTKTNGRGAGNIRLVMQDDGNLVLYDQNDQPLWSSNTSGR